MKISIGGTEIEVDGVDLDDLPDSFNFADMWEGFQEGQSVDQAITEVYSKEWVETARSDLFWREFFDALTQRYGHIWDDDDNKGTDDS